MKEIYNRKETLIKADLISKAYNKAIEHIHKYINESSVNLIGVYDLKYADHNDDFVWIEMSSPGKEHLVVGGELINQDTLRRYTMKYVIETDCIDIEHFKIKVLY